MVHISRRFLKIENRYPGNVTSAQEPTIIQQAFRRLPFFSNFTPANYSRPHRKACGGGSSNIGLFAVVRLMSSPRLSLLEGLAFLANASLMVSWLFASLLPFFHSVKNGLTVINIQLRKYKSYSNRCSGKILQIPTFFEILYSPICFRINAYVPYICFYIFHSEYSKATQ
jgi:hypothetical protein